MSYSSSNSFPAVRESPSGYSAFSPQSPVYELSLRTVPSSDWLHNLEGANRLVQALLQGRLLGHYALLDFLVWPEGLFLRVGLTGNRSLSEVLRFLKEKSAPPAERGFRPWDDELQWIKLVPAEKLLESSAAFLETVDLLRRQLRQSQGSTPHLFFFYRDSRLVR